MSDSSSFGRWLKERRQYLDMTQAELARKVGCSAVTIKKIEAGKLRPSRQLAELCARALDVPPEEREGFLRFARTGQAVAGVTPGVTESTSDFGARGGYPPTQSRPANSAAPPTLPLSYPNNLPVQPTPFLGRENELQAVRSLFEQRGARLVTLTGPGGIGKTRLALQAAAQLAGRHADGVFFVALASIGDPALVPSEIAQVLRVKESAGKPLAAALNTYLRDKQMLLVLDNFEQVTGAAWLVSDLLAGAPELRILVTSRTSLRVRGEHLYAVPPMELPNLDRLPTVQAFSQYEAVRLFIQSALDVKRDFAVTNDNAPAVAEICYHLDGIPLAIELAAARTRLLSPAAILRRLERRLNLLTSGPRDLPPRHQTLRAAIAWSYDLLDEEAKALFRRLSVFVGGFTIEAVEKVCMTATDRDPITPTEVTVLNGLENLANSSLIAQSSVGTPDGEPRFSMLETIREFGLEQLQAAGEWEQMKRRHALFFTEMAERADPELKGEHQGEWLTRVDADIHNFRAALAWSTQTDSEGEAAVERAERDEIGLRLAGALSWFWGMHGYLSEGRRHLDAALSSSRYGASGSDLPGERHVRARALDGAGHLAELQADYEAALRLTQEALAIYRELGYKAQIAHTLNNIGVILYNRGDYEGARSVYEESLVIKRELGDRRGIGTALNNLGVIADEQGDYARARLLFEESLALHRQDGDTSSMADTLINLGMVAWYQGDYGAARRFQQEALSVSRQIGNKRDIALALDNLGLVAHRQGDSGEAGKLFLESLQIFDQLGAKWGIAYCLDGLARVAATEGDLSRAARLWGAEQALREAIGSPIAPVDLEDHEGQVALAKALLDDQTWGAAFTEGRNMTLQQTVAYAWGPGEET